MKFLITPKQGPWVAVQDGVSREELRERILQCDVSLTDLDDTLAPSPAERLAFNYLFGERGANPKFLAWAMTTGLKLAAGKLGWTDLGDIKSEQWSRFVDKFLDSQESKKIKARFTPEYAAGTLFPGVKELYSSLIERGVYKIGFTRNITEIARAYQQVLELDLLSCRTPSKGNMILQVTYLHPELSRYLVFDDLYGGKDAKGILNVLEKAKRDERIEDVVSCQVRKSPRKLDDRFTVNIGRDYSGLVSLID